MREQTWPLALSPATVTRVSADEVKPLLDRFTADAGQAVPLDALWVHGSLALGDYQVGRSDIDLVAVVATALTGPRRRDLRRVHEALQADMPLAGQLHCAYMARSELGDAGRGHVTWAHRELFERIVSPVTRRELTSGGLSLAGPSPAGLVPAVSDRELADYIRGDLRDYWYPNTARPDLWLRDIWVDLGLLTLARATVTLTEGRLITKREALEVLADRGAPADVVRDIYRRRYEAPEPASEEWRARRASLARAYLRSGIEEVLALQDAGRDAQARQID